MYLPAHFNIPDVATLQALVQAHPLATWATVVDGLPVVNHVPFRLDPSRGEHGTLVGHVARANPVWRQPGPSVLAFQGAQAYVSPGWYPSKHEHGKVVPTWNYAVVHAHGTPVVVEDRAALRAIVDSLTQVNEAAMPRPWAVGDAPADYIDTLLGAIVGIELPVQRWVGKFKLSQNQATANRQGVVQGLQAQDPAHPLATLMQQHAPRG